MAIHRFLHGLVIATAVLGWVAEAEDARQPIWLLGMNSYTSGVADIAFSSQTAVDLMVEEINKKPDLLPGYKLHIVWQDSRCSSTVAQPLFLNVVFRSKYRVLDPTVSLATVDEDQDGVISTEEREKYVLDWNATHVDPAPVALIGPGCSGASAAVITVAYFANMPIISGASTFPGLSDRERYPNFYRTILPDSEGILMWIEMAIRLGHNRVTVVTGLDTVWDSQVELLAREAKEKNVQLVGNKHDEGFYGYRVAETSSDTPFRDVTMQLMRRGKSTRIVMIMLYQPHLVRQLCQNFKHGFFSAVYMFHGWYPHGWWQDSHSCSSEEMLHVAAGYIDGPMTMVRDDSDTILSCTENMTVKEFSATWPSREVSRHVPSKARNYAEGNTFSDAVCVYAQMLHKVLIDRKVPLADLVQRKTSAYQAMQEELAQTSFEGLTGHVSFKGADPVATVSVRQLIDGERKMVATFASGKLTFLPGATLRFQFPGEILGVGATGSLNGTLQQFADCDEVLNFSSNTCQNCSNNSAFLPSAGSCVCNAGYYKGMADTVCQACEPGRRSGNGFVECDLCQRGAFSPAAADECEFCPRGSFQASTGQGRCTTCPSNKTTAERASKSISDCKCPRGTYISADGVGCSSCPGNADTAQLAARNVTECRCKAGTYMSRSFDTCRACPTHMECPVGSYIGYFDHTVDFNRSLLGPLLLKVGYWSSEADPTSLFRCRQDVMCPGGSPGNPCKEHLTGQACDHCDTGRYWTSKGYCEECSGMETALFCIPFVLLPMLVLGFYRFFRDPLRLWASWQNCISSLLFVLLNHFQVLGTLADAHLIIPPRLISMLNIFAYSSDMSALVSMDCLGLRDLINSMGVKALYPVAMAGTCLTAYFTSVLCGKLLKRPALVMDRNRLFNVFGSIMFAFFNAVVGMSVVLFVCKDNPNGLLTLAVDLSVICFHSDVWLGALGIGIACVAVYIVGMGSLFVQSIYFAPKHFHDENFQIRWKFLFIRFHSGAYWWGIVFLAKNCCLNLVPIIVSQDAPRLLLTFTVVVTYLGLVMVKRPFRLQVVNWFEILSGVCLVYIICMFSYLLDRKEEGIAVDVCVVLSVLPSVAFPVFLTYVLAISRREKREVPVRGLSSSERQLAQVKESFEAFSRLDPKSSLEMMMGMGEAERSSLCHCAWIIQSDLLGAPTRKRITAMVPTKSGIRQCVI